MLQSLLSERFQLRLLPEPGDLPVYALVVGRKGRKFAHSTANRGGVVMLHGQLNMTAQPVSSLVDRLAGELGRPVVDETGLNGNYDLTLKWTPDEDVGGGVSSDSSGPALFTAIQEQLGLKLESRKGFVKILIIDHVEKPSEN